MSLQVKNKSRSAILKNVFYNKNYLILSILASILVKTRKELRDRVING